MFVTTILSLVLISSPQGLSISKIETTPREVVEFGGVTVEINQSELQNVRDGEVVVVRDFPLGEDAQVELRLQRFEVLTKDAEIVTASVNMNGEVLHRQFVRPDVVLLKGAIEGDPSSRVFLAIGEHTTNGLIESDGKTYVIAKDIKRGWTTVYNLTNVDPEKMNWVDFACGVEDATAPIIKKANTQSRNLAQGCQSLQIAVETDWEFTGMTFGGNSAASSEYVVTLLGAVSTIFQSNTGIQLQLSYLRLWETSSDPWDATSTGDQLQEFRVYWEIEMDDVNRHLAHFISGRNLGGGMAFLSGVCTTNFGYAVSANMRGSFPLPLEDNHWNNWDVMVVAHELGHNCSSGHTHDYSPPIDNCGNGDCSDAFGGTIMSYCHTCSGGMTNIVLDYDIRVQVTMIEYLTGPYMCSLDCDQFLFGACCIQDVCSDLIEEDCISMDGIFLGTGTQCIMGGCVPLNPGACCSGESVECNILDEDVCLISGGTFLGVDVTCEMGWCEPDAPFACCFGDSCSDLSSTECEVLEGYWLGIGTQCSSTPCNPPPNNFCADAFQVHTGVYDFTSIGAFNTDLPINHEVTCPNQYAGDTMYSDVWFWYKACYSGQLLVSTCDIVDFDSTIVVYTGSCEDSIDDLVEVECNGDFEDCGGFTSELSMNVVANEIYIIRVGGFGDGSSGVGQIVIGGDNCHDIQCVGDTDENGEVDVLDLLLIIDHWGEVDSIQYDINEDGIVGLGDILLILQNWGHCQ